jgi:putative MATE family efflux protein
LLLSHTLEPFLTTDLTRPLKARLNTFFTDREYYRQLVIFALPLGLQNLIISSLNMVGVVMIGQLGETPVAAVGLAAQIFFLLQLVLFGINSGASMFTAQLWGKGDLPNIRKVLALAILLGLVAGSIFLGLAWLAPQIVMGIYSEDPQVVALGSQYLRIFGWAYLFFPVTFSFSMVMRSIGDVKTPMLVSIAALAYSALASYLLIFGKLGLPALGVRGAALAALTARILECAVMLRIVYRRRALLALHLKDLLGLDLSFIGRVFKPMLPVILNETFWSFGTTAYSVVYARIGTDSIAAINIVSTIDNMAFVFIFGLANATAIMVGNRIGAGEEHKAFQYAVRSLLLGMLFGVLVGSQVLLWSPYLLALYKVPPVVIDYASKVLVILASLAWLRAANSIIIVGILRSGGDTRFSFFLDGVVIWVVGVPVAFFTAFVLHLPVYWVYLAIMSEEFLKWMIGLRRTFSRKWIHNLTHSVG